MYRFCVLISHMYIHSGVVAVLLFNIVRTCHTTLLFACFLNNLLYFYLCDCVSVCTHVYVYQYVHICSGAQGGDRVDQLS